MGFSTLLRQGNVLRTGQQTNLATPSRIRIWETNSWFKYAPPRRHTIAYWFRAPSDLHAAPSAPGGHTRGRVHPNEIKRSYCSQCQECTTTARPNHKQTKNGGVPYLVSLSL